MYRQAPAFAGGERSILDLLAVDHAGRLVVVEVKASEDLHLPLQALDYWIRVRWHAQQEDFQRSGYFPGVALQSLPPRLILVAPALSFHPTTEALVRPFLDRRVCRYHRRRDGLARAGQSDVSQNPRFASMIEV